MTQYVNRDIIVLAILVIVAIALYVWIWRSVNRANDEESSRESRWYAGMSRLAEHARTSSEPTPGFDEVVKAVNRITEKDES